MNTQEYFIFKNILKIDNPIEEAFFIYGIIKFSKLICLFPAIL